MAIKLIKVPSNKLKTTVKMTDQPDAASTNSSPTPFIDKLSIMVTPANVDDAHAMHHAMKVAFASKTEFQSAGYEAKKGYNDAKLVPVKGSEQRPLIQYRYSEGKTEKVRIEFNPRKLGVDGLGNFGTVLVSLMDNGWEYVEKYGKITRIDIAVDFPGKRPEDFLFLPDIATTERSWSRQGYLQSIALGKGPGSQKLVYNVKAKRLNKGQPWKGAAATRIECRVRNLEQASLTALMALPNPFAGLTLVPQMPGPPFVGDPSKDKSIAREWAVFQDSIKVRTLGPALALVPDKRAAVYRKHLKANALPWWKPDEIWLNWPKALKVLKP